MYDIIIRGGSLVDGTGAEPVLGDLAIKDGLIAARARRRPSEKLSMQLATQ